MRTETSAGSTTEPVNAALAPRDNERLWFATHERAQKAKNLEHQTWVVLRIGDGDDVIVLEGEAKLVRDESELTRVDAARGKKYVEPRTGERDTILLEGTLVYRVQPRRVMAWIYGNMSTFTVWGAAG